VTVSRPGGLPASPDLLEPPPRRSVPMWVKAAAVVVVVALIAVANSTAKRGQQRAERLAADRVEATMLAAGGDAGDRTFTLDLLVVNRGKDPILVKAGRRVVPPSYDALAFEDRVVAAGATEQVDMPFRARCPVRSPLPTGRVQLVVPMAPASGRVRDVSTDIEEQRLWDLQRQACGYLPLQDSLALSVRGVSATRYSVLFTLDVHNVSARRVVLVDVTSPGLAVAVRGGVPVLVNAGTTAPLAMSAALPACSRLPASGPPSRGGALRYGALALQLRDAGGATATRPYALGADGAGVALLTELFALRNRICPGAGVPTGTGRPRFG
jgi:hypothetical protein